MRREFGIGIERVGDDDLARLEPRDLGGKRRRSHSAMRNSPVEMSIQASAKRAGSALRGRARAHDRQQIIVARGVEQRVFGQRAGRDQPHHVAPHDALGAALLAPRPGLPAARRPRPGGRARSACADIRRSGRSARRTSGCRCPDACRAWSARCRARGRRSRHPRRTIRRNRPSGRTAGNPDWPP